MKINIENKNSIVQKVFNHASEKYDLMNDIMSFGTHRIWKRQLMNWLAPSNDKRLIDVACGTGDLIKLFVKYTHNKCEIDAVDSNSKMISAGKKKLKNLKKIRWHICKAEKLQFKDNSFDYYTISFGIRNVSNISKAIKEAYRVLKPGGRFMCLEFSKIQNNYLNKLYELYSKNIPTIGKYILGESMPYEYLIKSIEEFYSQDELLELLKKNNFYKVKYRNLSGGIVAIHSGWKV